jgi:GNAT superfamily N-acetyltransferase
MQPFAIFALPRSRTAWLTRFLTSGPWVAVHDVTVQVKDFRTIRELLEIPQTGIVDTGLAFAWPVLKRFVKGCRFAVVRRPIAEVEASLLRHGVKYMDGQLETMDGYLDELAALPDVVSVDFSDLATEQGCRKISEHCIGSFDVERYREMANVNIQIDFPECMKSLNDNVVRFSGLLRELRSLMAPCTYQTERWRDIRAESIALTQEHAKEVGQVHPEMPFDPDYQMADFLDSQGRLVVATARAAGRLVGQCGFVLGPTLESRRVITATQVLPFVLPEFRNQRAGLKLVPAAIPELQARGVKMLHLRHGTRGASPKLRRHYESLGAKENGTEFAMWIGGSEMTQNVPRQETSSEDTAAERQEIIEAQIKFMANRNMAKVISGAIDVR